MLLAALDTERRRHGLSWNPLAQESPGFTESMLTNLATRPLIGFPWMTMLTQWLRRPAADFVRDHARETVCLVRILDQLVNCSATMRSERA